MNDKLTDIAFSFFIFACGAAVMGLVILIAYCLTTGNCNGC